MRRELPLRVVATVLVIVATASCDRCGGASGGSSDSAAPSSSISVPSVGSGDAGADADTSELPVDAPFEGTLVASASTIGDDTAAETDALYTFTMKAHAVRWDVYADRTAEPAKKDQVAYRVFDGVHNRFYTVFPSDRVILVADVPTVEAAEFGAPKPYDLVPVTPPGPGKIADYPCERMTTKDTEHRYETCVAKGLVPFPLHLLSGAVGKILAFNPELLRKDLFPLAGAVYSLPKKGVKDAGPNIPFPTGRFIVRKIERRRVDDKLFVLPGFPMTQVNRLQYGAKKAQ